MATSYPYISSAGPFVKTVERLRKQFPAEVTADTLKKLGVAPKNESYVINILKFLELIEDDGKKAAANPKAFLQNDDAKFAKEFESIVKPAYSALFDLYGEDAWTQDREELVTFFRTSDGSSDVVGRRQAITFGALAALSGHGELAVPRIATPRTPGTPKPKKPAAGTSSAPVAVAPGGGGSAGGSVGLTVRIEVNLPANGDQKTYDAIFQSIRKNLIDGD